MTTEHKKAKGEKKAYPLFARIREMDFFLLSKVGKRVFALFALSLLLPLMGLTAFVFFSINRQTTASAEDFIRQKTKSKGFEINDRLGLADSYLRAVTSAAGQGFSIPQDIVSNQGPFKAILIKMEFHPPVLLAGSKNTTFPELPEGAFRHMQESHAQMLITKSGEIFLLRTVKQQERGEPYVMTAGLLNTSFIWGEWDCFSKYGELSMAVIDSVSGRVLSASFCREHNYDSKEFVRTALIGKTFFKGKNGEKQILFTWQLFLKYHYNTGNWIIATSMPEEMAKLEGNTLKIYFGAFIAFICFVTFLIAMRSIRKTLIPIRHLRRASEMIGHGKFDFRINLDTGDEFEDLAESFNIMSERLATLTHELAEEKRQELKRIINLSSAIAILWENAPEHPVRFVSDNISGIGYSPDEIYEMKEPLSQILTSEDFSRLQKNISTYMEDGQLSQLTGEYKVRKSNGAELWVELRLMARRPSGGEISHFEGLIIDIEARKKAEDDLLAAKEEAEKAYRTKSEFLADMSHEIRTPMNAVLGMAELMSSTRLDQEQKEYLDLIRQSGFSLLDIINSVLDLSKIEAGKMTVATHVFNLRQTISSIVKSLSFSASEKDLKISSNIEQEIPEYLKGDPGKLKQILMNLISNAVKFTFSGGIEVRAELADKSETSAVVRFAVSDSGIGIPEDKKNYIFENFMQLSDDTTNIKGSGLGLPICLKLIRLMHGEISFESTPGKGSSFIFQLSFEKPSAAEICHLKDLEEEEARKAETLRHSRKALKILAAEDNSMNQKLIRKMLEKDGHSVTIVDNGRDAVHAALEQDFDIILMDVEMPELDGYEATRIIRNSEKERDRHNVIIALTAYAFHGDREKCIAAGMNDYLAKPITRTALAAMLAEHCPQ